MVDTRRMSLKGTGMGPVALRCRVSDINRTPDGHWDLSARMLEDATAGRVIVRVPDASRMRNSLEQRGKSSMERGRTLKSLSVFCQGEEQLSGKGDRFLHPRQIVRLTAPHSNRLRKNMIRGKFRNMEQREFQMIHRMKKGARYSKIGPAAGFGDGHFPDTGTGDCGKSVAFLFPVELFRRILMDRNRRVERNRRESLLLNPRLIVHVAVFLFFSFFNWF